MMRSALLYLSTQPFLRHWAETSPVASRLTKRFVAGQTLEEALDVGLRLDRDCVMLTLDRLGENVTNLTEAKAALEGYLEAVHRLADMNIRGTVSIKLTQFGLDISEAACRNNVETLVREAKDCGKSIEVDMESSGYVDRTLKLVAAMHEKYGNVRGVIQAYLYRSEKDVGDLCARRVPVRLCKGAYKEPRSVAFQKKKQVDANYLKLMRILLESGNYPGIATHDGAIIEAAKQFVRERGISVRDFEFQMLYGIRRDLEKQLVREGYRLRLYVPYGEAWFPYFMRRLAERPANVMFLLRNLARG